MTTSCEFDDVQGIDADLEGAGAVLAAPVDQRRALDVDHRVAVVVGVRAGAAGAHLGEVGTAGVHLEGVVDDLVRDQVGVADLEVEVGLEALSAGLRPA